jgi:Flp pilus assembly protein TadD
MDTAPTPPARRRRPGLAVLVSVLVLGLGGVASAARAGFDRAVVAFESGDYPGAIVHLEQTLRTGRESARDRILLGWSYLKLGDLGRAQVELQRGLELGPRDPNAYYAHEGLGWIAYRAGEHGRALAAFNEALRLTPGYHNAHNGLGWVHLARRDLVRAEANFMAALMIARDDRDARRGLGFVAYHRGNWGAAIERFQSVLLEEDGDAVTRSALGWAHYYKGDPATARQVFREVARQAPTWVGPLVGLGWVADRQGHPEEAKASFRAAIARSAVHVATADPAASLRRLLAGRPEWLDLWRELGWALYHQRAPALAEAEFRALLRAHPEDPDGLRGLGYALYALRRFREAIPPLERALAEGGMLPPVTEQAEIPGVPGAHPITTDAASTLGWCHFQAGNTAQALRHFRDVTARQPDWADAWSGLGWALAKSGEKDEAERSFRRSLATRPGHPEALRGIQELGRRP